MGLVIQAEGLGKRYRLGEGGYATLREQLTRRVVPGGESRERQEIWALRDVDLEIRAGETLALVGASGSGKSTLLNILAGLDRPTAGDAVVSGHNLLSMAVRERVRYQRHTVGFVWQQTSRNLLPYLTAAENVAVIVRAYDLPEIAGSDFFAADDGRNLDFATEHFFDLRLEHLPLRRFRRVAVHGLVFGLGYLENRIRHVVCLLVVGPSILTAIAKALPIGGGWCRSGCLASSLGLPRARARERAWAGEVETLDSRLPTPDWAGGGTSDQ